jgi:hypothetical protein
LTPILARCSQDDLFTEEEAALLKGKNNILAGIDFEVLTNADVTALTFHGMMKSSISGAILFLQRRMTLLTVVGMRQRRGALIKQSLVVMCCYQRPRYKRR